MLRPEEIMVPVFSKGLKGYNPQEVDNFINQIISEYRELYFRYSETEEKLEMIVEKYKQTSSKAAEALNGVKQMSEAIISDAQEEGERIVCEARAKANAATEAMKESCGDILESYASAFEKEKNKFLVLEEKSRKFREALLEAYKNHVSDIQKHFPSMSAEDFDSIDFEAEVYDNFKSKMNIKGSDD